MTLIEEIKALELKSVEELYEILGEQLLSKTLGADEFSDEEKSEEAIEWEKQQEVSLRKAICTSSVYRAWVENPRGWDWIMITAGLADVIAPVVVGVAPLTVATLILKKGLDNFCANNKR